MNKRFETVKIMKAHEDKSMSEVARMISESLDMPLPQARAYYVWAVRSGNAPGVIVLEKRGRKLGSKLVRKNTDDTKPDTEADDHSQDGICYDTFNNIMKDVLEEIKTEPPNQNQVAA